MKKVYRKEFMSEVKEGSVQIDNNSFYSVVKVNSDNIEMNEDLKQQLINEGKYDETYIGIIANQEHGPYPMNLLPIYGSAERYETKWFVETQAKAASKDLRDKGVGLLDRYIAYNK